MSHGTQSLSEQLATGRWHRSEFSFATARIDGFAADIDFMIKSRMAVGPLFQPVAKCARSRPFATGCFDFGLQTVGHDFADVGVNFSAGLRHMLLQSGNVFRWQLQMNI